MRCLLAYLSKLLKLSLILDLFTEGLMTIGALNFFLVEDVCHLLELFVTDVAVVFPLSHPVALVFLVFRVLGVEVVFNVIHGLLAMFKVNLEI